jgi:hypothetical protein
MTKLYLDNNGHYQKFKEHKTNWANIIAKTIVYLTMFAVMVFYFYLLLNN